MSSITGACLSDIAIGAPFELDGAGAVYIYLGSSTGVSDNQVPNQKVTIPGVRGFGFSIAPSWDVDNNGFPGKQKSITCLSNVL